MKRLAYLSLCLLLMITNLSAQLDDFADLEDEITQTQNKWRFAIGYTFVNDKNFKSDALDLDLAWYFINDLELDFPDLWDQATLSLGPCIAVRVNSGKLNNDLYSELNRMLEAGLATRIDFKESYLEFDLKAGQLWSNKTMKSGFTSKKENVFFSGKIAYHQLAGRLQEEYLFPTWNVALSGGLPTSDQQVFDWGFNDLEHRQDESGQNINSIHGEAKLGLFDIPFTESFKLGFNCAGVGGKYNTDIYYWGLGAGTEFVFDNMTAFYINARKIWGWYNNKNDNWYIGIGIRYDFFQKLY